MQKNVPKGSSLSRNEQKLVDRFLVAFNGIEKHLRVLTGSEGTFGNVINESRKRSLITNEDYFLLRTVTSLRNALVHDRVDFRHYPVVPTTPFVQEVEQLRARIRPPLLVIPTFAKEVEVVSLRESLSSVLKLIEQRDYSQFPAYDDGRFKGLLTENGITRWLAHHVSKELSLIELDEVSVRMVLREEEFARLNSRFVPQTTTLGEVKRLFNEHELLEAVLITPTGSAKETLLGIVTRWDIVQLR